VYVYYPVVFVFFECKDVPQQFKLVLNILCTA